MKPKFGFGQYSLFNILLFMLPIVMGGWHAASAEDIKSGSPTVISLCEWHITHSFAKETVRAAYHHIGIATKFVELPCRRSLVEANTGNFDGEVARIAGTDKLYQNLIPIESPTVSIQGVVITKSIDHPIIKWSDLAGLKIGIIRGELYAEQGTVGMMPKMVASYHELMTLIAKGHLDVGVVIKRDFEIQNSAPQFVGRGIHIIGKPVYRAFLYHFVHEKNRSIVPKLNVAFRQMWKSGETQSIHRQTLLNLIGQSTSKQ
ncbi:MAG: transporter substrate-binding domain-containing protein [Sneathiella sp.]|nr:transporter substrate-binding domain-containing protein [Sneathiella sp.]